MKDKQNSANQQVTSSFERRYLSMETKSWTSDDLCYWLQDLGFSDYIPAFVANHVDGAMLIELNKDELKELGFENKFHLRKIIMQRDAQLEQEKKKEEEVKKIKKRKSRITNKVNKIKGKEETKIRKRTKNQVDFLTLQTKPEKAQKDKRENKESLNPKATSQKVRKKAGEHKKSLNQKNQNKDGTENYFHTPTDTLGVPPRESLWSCSMKSLICGSVVLLILEILLIELLS